MVMMVIISIFHYGSFLDVILTIRSTRYIFASKVAHTSAYPLFALTAKPDMEGWPGRLEKRTRHEITIIFDFI